MQNAFPARQCGAIVFEIGANRQRERQPSSGGTSRMTAKSVTSGSVRGSGRAYSAYFWSINGSNLDCAAVTIDLPGTFRSDCCSYPKHPRFIYLPVEVDMPKFGWGVQGAMGANDRPQE
jgi:hypothetical protein